MGKNINRNDFDAFKINALKLYNQVLMRLFLEVLNKRKKSIFNWFILGCSIIAALTGVIGLFYH